MSKRIEEVTGCARKQKSQTETAARTGTNSFPMPHTSFVTNKPQIGLFNIDVVPSQFAEDLDHSLGALNYVLETASAKARDVYKIEVNNPKGEPALVIAADTIIVSHAGRILEKPRGEADHIAMLKMLRDEGEHKVMTAIAIMRPLDTPVAPGYNMETHVEETTVKFDSNGA
jgi:septum formation protein